MVVAKRQIGLPLVKQNHFVLSPREHLLVLLHTLDILSVGFEHELRFDVRKSLNSSNSWMLYHEPHNLMNYIQGMEILLLLKNRSISLIFVRLNRIEGKKLPKEKSNEEQTETVLQQQP